MWHERWGEDYDGDGGCVKYTDKARPLNLPCQYIHALYSLMSGLLRPLKLQSHPPYCHDSTITAF